ncbi:MAG: DUF2842 domain-containing protein [Hyphomicrobiales bacterium]|nr:DUF2842 domain-containing protein [Hyphomicrobiales bacterium]
MTIRTRKLLGTIAIVSFSSLYFFVAITIALARLPDTSVLVQMAFYFVTTLIWFIFAAAVIYWMQKQPATRAQATEALRP